MRIIEIQWDGPYKTGQVSQFNGPTDYGLYQIYGSHNIFGSDSLLYIGICEAQHFAQRIKQHDWWTNWESSDVDIYLGRLGGIKQLSNEEWNHAILDAEKLLVFFTSPPYNSSNINKYGDFMDTIVINYRRKHRLPYEVSTLPEQSLIGKPEWKLFEER